MDETIREDQRRFFNAEYGSSPGEAPRDGGMNFYVLSPTSKGHYRELIGADCAGRKVLEIGCGMSGDLTFLSRSGAYLTGIDISDVGVERSTERAREESLENTEFRVMDAERMQFADNTFDLVCGKGILHHLSLERSLKEIQRVVKPGGRAVFVEPLAHNPAISLYRMLTPKLRTRDEHPLTGRDLRFLKGFFHEARYTYYHLFTLLAVPFASTRAFPPLFRAFDGLDRMVFRCLPFLRLLAWQVVIELRDPVKSPGLIHT